MGTVTERDLAINGGHAVRTEPFPPWPYFDEETIQEAARKGASTFIAKPFTPDELIETVRQIIKKQD